jgi:hypothetical protein
MTTTPTTPTLDQRAGQGRISPHLCRAIRALRTEGWTVREVAFALELTEKTVTRHDNGRCGCADSNADASGEGEQ